MPRRTLRGRRTTAAALISTSAALTLAATLVQSPANARPDTAPARHRDGTAAGVMEHLQRLEAIGDRHDGRASGTPGYRASRDYVVKKLRKAGYEPRVQEFDFPYFEQLGPSTLERTAPTQQTYVEDTDYVLMTYSGSGDVTAPVQGVDLALGDLATSTSGCEDADFAGFTAGNIALVRRGTCPFSDKVTNAEEAGASAVIVMNQGTAGRTDALAGTLGGPGTEIPAIGTSFAAGEALSAAGTSAHVATDTASEIRTTWNVLAETRGSRKNVVMAGAHLDSILGGNGINDNGSGSAALLEVAESMGGQAKPNNRVRFAWWGAEELGLLGSDHYVAQLSAANPKRFQKIALYLNFDMVGSPNYALMVYDGNNSAYPVGPDAADGPKGSGAIERSFHRFFEKYGTGSDETPFSGRSDYGAFIALNVPAGGLFTGAEGVKTPEQAAKFGGTAGESYDECYHAECDDLGNVSRRAIKANTAAILHSVTKYARSTRSVNGDRTGHQPPPPAATPRRSSHAAHAHPGDPVAR
ncbi:M28 family peptidase [Nocardioides dongkuii]|uniref:M28 family peptidase n=1 Tax=Nocardioides dongkuii TaxID=2760089 RepID=UPI0015FE056A|nr:M28 family peptidase [Nocardioides dongkuii]